MSYLLNKKNQKIRYKFNKGKSPGIIFIHGLNSDMNGLKAKSIEKYARKNGLAFICFDCRGHCQHLRPCVGRTGDGNPAFD